ncbi:phosphoglucosamine mutase [Fulvivirga sedimenti]|uniref:Phosphoglucosamine mutase n=1 Tax=Fulvivirga sedimenti TaxID=2879465 RepID=A0A9X1HV87_9BACT|nr:phosphoglucosamine mutase [Fulvivirga sedimenti]
MVLIKSISGIRGTIGGQPGSGLTPLDTVKFAAAFGAWTMRNSDSNKVVIGRDARISGEMISQLVSQTLIGMGIDVVDLGLSTTPTVEMAVTMEKASGGIIITASHNPGQWNALKLLNQAGEFISDEEGKTVLKIAEDNSYEFAEVLHLGTYKKDDSYLDKHIKAILDLPLVNTKAIAEAKFKVAVDAVNSTGGIAVPRLLRALGVEHIKEIYCDPTGHFPHNPEPLPENLTHISNEMNKGNYDLGIVVDPDVDRLALLQEDGTPFGEEYTLVAVADYVLGHNKGNTVSNLSSTMALRVVTEEKGGNYFASAVGEVNVVTEMKKQNAVIGGEGNGGVIYPELHYGRDALVGIALFLSHLATSGMKASRLRASYPNFHISKNKIELTPEIDVDGILDSIRKKYSKRPINAIDGVKIEWDEEWVHLRKSNTEPIIRIYSESSSESTAEHLANKLIADIKDVIADMNSVKE